MPRPDKHLFVVHSGITAVLSEAVAEHLKLSYSRIVVAHFRGTFPVLDGATHLRGQEKLDRPSWAHRKRFRSQRNELWNRIEAAVEDRPFAAYLPQWSAPAYRAIGLHPRCVQLNYIEEGTDAHLEAANLPRGAIPGAWWKRPAIAIGCFGPRGLSPNVLLDRHYKVGSDTAFYYISQAAFPWAQRRIHLQPPKVPTGYHLPEVLIVLSPLARQFESTFEYPARGSLAVSELLPALSRVGSLLYAQGYRHVAIKFHMMDRDLPTVKRMAIGAINRHETLEVTTLSDDTILEPLMAGKKIIGMATSALHYANFFGGEAYLMGSVLSPVGQDWLRRMLAQSVLTDLPDIEAIPYYSGQ